MTTSEKQLQEWGALVPKLNDDADDHMDVAHSVDMRPEHTANYRHAKNAHEAAYAIQSLIAELRETMESLRAGLKQLGKERSRALAAESDLAATKAMLASKKILIESAEAKLAESQARTAQILSVAERMRCAGGPQEFQHWFDELKSFLLRKQDTSALDAAIAAKEKP